MEHTPTPWEYKESDIWGMFRIWYGLRTIADIRNDYPYLKHAELEANAAFIVKACNNYEKIVEKAKNAVQCVMDHGFEEGEDTRIMDLVFALEAAGEL